MKTRRAELNRTDHGRDRGRRIGTENRRASRYSGADVSVEITKQDGLSLLSRVCRPWMLGPVTGFGSVGFFSPQPLGPDVSAQVVIRVPVVHVLDQVQRSGCFESCNESIPLYVLLNSLSHRCRSAAYSATFAAIQRQTSPHFSDGIGGGIEPVRLSPVLFNHFI